MIRPCLALAPGSPPRVAFPLRLASGPEAIVTRIAIRLWTIRGTWPTDTRVGMDWLRLAGPSVSAVEVEALARRQVAAVGGVVQVLDVTVQWQGEQRALAVRVLLPGGVVAVVGDLAVADVARYDPGAWYILIRPRGIA